MHMDISLYEQQVEELNRKLTFQRSRYLKEEYEHYRITDMQYSVLSYIQQHPCTTIGSVAKALHTDAGNMSALCKKLEHSGYLIRKKGNRMNVLWSFAQVKAEHFAYRRYRVRSKSTMRSSGSSTIIRIRKSS